MFVHATLKDTVFGIDNNLRKAFLATCLCSPVSVSYHSLLEVNFSGECNRLRSSWWSICRCILACSKKKPILVILDKASNRFIPSTHAPEETAYLEALLATAMEDLIITARGAKNCSTRLASTLHA